MASYNELNALIDAYINRNGVQAITGQILNGVLKAMVEQLGRGYTIMGAATPATDPGTPDGPECYFASATGTYTDFDGLQVVPGELALLCYTPSDGWTKATIYEGFQEVGATIDGNVGTPSVGVSYADGVLSFDFHNMKGNPGQNGQDGQDGAAAGFGTIGADITGGVGTPGVTVESSGPATAKNLQFHFTNLKGETGVTSVVATVDNTTGTPACTVSLVGQQLTLAFTGLKGAQGNTGSSVDYPFTIVNNLTTDDATQALSAAQGVVLQGEITQLEAELNQLDLKVDGLPSIGETQEDGFYITDENGNAILQLKDGNIRTKNFDSEGSVPLISNDDSDADLNVVDSAGNVILQLKGGNIKTKSFDSNLINPFSELDILCLGDSITWYGGDDCTGDRGWTKWFKEKAKPKSMRSFARSGATLTSQATSTVDIEDYSSSRNAKNVAYNQLARVSAAYAGTPSSHDEVLTDAPDIVFLAFGTNDLTVDSVYDETPASEFDGVTTYATYSINQLLTIAKAMRYICEQLYVLFPDTQIVCIAPQQQAYNEASGKKNSSGYLALGDLFEQCCDFLSINCIRLDKHCGTYDIREIVEDHKFPSGDHQHPNALGARENGYYIFNQVKTFLKY